MAANVAIVDERDPSIHYAGTWNEAGVSAEFNSTTKWSATQGSTASFTFVGTSTIVYGTVAAKSSPQSSLTFVIDNSVVGTYTPPSDLISDIHHEALWASPSMANGSHTLVITQTAAQAEGVIYLDYIMYNTTSSSVGSYFIDDRDPRIKYTPAWRKFGSDPDFQHTSQGSTSAGDSFSLQFEGKSISFYGGINNGSVGEVLNASIVIDGGPPKFFVPGIQPEGVTTNNLIFDSGDLTDGNHTLVVTAQNDHTVWTDYFLVTPSTLAPGTFSVPPASPSPTSRPSQKSTPIGAIVGLVVGGLVVIALAVAVTLFWRRRHRRVIQSPEAPMSHSEAESPPVSEWGLTAPPLSSRGYFAVATSTDSLPWIGYPSAPSSGSDASVSNLAPYGATVNPPPGPTVPAGILPSTKLQREAERGGHYNRSEPVGEQPPQYSEH